MKKKGLLVVFFFGGIMLTSGFGLSSMIAPADDNSDVILTGTPLIISLKIKELHFVVLEVMPNPLSMFKNI